MKSASVLQSTASSVLVSLGRSEGLPERIFICFCQPTLGTTHLRPFKLNSLLEVFLDHTGSVNSNLKRAWVPSSCLNSPPSAKVETSSFPCCFFLCGHSIESVLYWSFCLWWLSFIQRTPRPPLHLVLVVFFLSYWYIKSYSQWFLSYTKYKSQLDICHFSKRKYLAYN